MSGGPPRLPLDATALFLDFDGTLVEIAPQPELVRVAEDLPALLEDLARGMGHAVAVVTGRPVAEIDGFLGPVRLAAAGAHGAELREPGSHEIVVSGTPLPDPLRQALESLVSGLQQLWPGLRREDKGTAYAIHYRQAPEAEAALRVALEQLPLGAAWQLLAGHRVFEIKARGWSKGSAVRRLMRHAAFAGRRPVFVGDDRTDLDGIAAAVALGGAGIAVGGLESPEAEWRLPDPAAVRDWLRALL